MDFSGSISERISHLFDNDIDEIVVFILLFIFIFFVGEQDNAPANGLFSKSSFPVIVIAIFLVLFLIIGNTREIDE